jgi:uncharacterized protein YecE (DUF72 family)
VARINVGTAGWSIPREVRIFFPEAGSALERYAAIFPIAEINSSFHRPHRTSTWERWRDSVPPDFRFSVKIPKQITHEQKLVGCSEALQNFIEEANHLREKLAVLLVQLPPKLAFEERIAAEFFSELKARSGALIACEPRNPSWFSKAADQLLDELSVARIAADPALCEEAARPGGWKGLSYWRLHGSPIKYRSSYEDRILGYGQSLTREADAGRKVWCIFDNTGSSAAAANALQLLRATAQANS